MRAVCRYEEDDYKWAENHGKRCFDGFSKREWSCSCHGKLKTLIATQCTQCSFWFHKTCKSQQRNAWESGGKKATAEWCLSCEEGRTPPERLAGCNLQHMTQLHRAERVDACLHKRRVRIHDVACCALHHLQHGVERYRPSL